MTEFTMDLNIEAPPFTMNPQILSRDFLPRKFIELGAESVHFSQRLQKRLNKKIVECYVRMNDFHLRFSRTIVN